MNNNLEYVPPEGAIGYDFFDNVAKSGMRSWWCVAIIAPPGP